MKIAFVTPELEPLVKRTPLADLAAALPKALKEAGNDARIFLPFTQLVHLSAVNELVSAGAVTVADASERVTFQIHRGLIGAVPIYLFEHSGLFGSRAPYGGDEGPYPDNWRRYALFSRAVLESLPVLDFEPEVIHGFDWTTGLLPVLQQLEFAERRPDHPAAKAGTYFQIFNLASQGTFEREILKQIGLPHRIFQSIGGIELAGKVNFLKAGAEFGTIIGTHSPGHALRIQELDRGYGLEECFRRRSKELVGIANGIDYHTWDPATDPLLAKPFSGTAKNLNGKAKCKSVVQSLLSLDAGARTPLAAMIGRFDADSGFDLVAEVLTSVLERGVEVVLMGAGRPDITERLKTMQQTFVGRCRVIEGYQLAAAHQILAGADMLLLPSHYHPGNSLCAIGMRYGAVPIIYAGSGLDDYVVDMEKTARSGTGFHFANYTSASLLTAIDAARKVYKNPTLWRQLTSRCLRQDFSWGAVAQEYIKAYRRVTRRTKPRQQSA